MLNRRKEGRTWGDRLYLNQNIVKEKKLQNFVRNVSGRPLISLIRWQAETEYQIPLRRKRNLFPRWRKDNDTRWRWNKNDVKSRHELLKLLTNPQNYDNCFIFQFIYFEVFNLLRDVIQNHIALIQKTLLLSNVLK